MSDIVEYLRGYADLVADADDMELHLYAADELTKLRAENERLKKALADQSWKAEYDRVMNPETGRDGWL